MKGLVFTYVLTYGGAVVSLFNPYWGFLIYVCFAIIKPESLWFWSVPEGNYSRIVAVAMLAGWALHGFGDWRLGKAKWVAIGLFGYWLWVGLSTIQAPNSEVAWTSFELQSKIVLPCLAGLTLIKSVRHLKQLAWVILLSQAYLALEFNLAYLSDGGAWIRWFRAKGFGGMDNNCISIAMVAGAGLAGFMGLQADRWWQKLLAGAAAILMAHVVLLAFSRGGMLGLIVMAGVGFLLIPKKLTHYLGLALAVVVVLMLAGPEVRERFATTFKHSEELDSSAESRLDLWRGCLDVMQHNPAFGCGPDHWRLVASQYGVAEGKSAHTLWLKVGAELGFPGLGFLALFYGLCAWMLWPFTRENRPASIPEFRPLARMVVAALAGFAVSAQFVGLDRLEVPFYIAIVGAGVLKLASRTEGATIRAEAHGAGELAIASGPRNEWNHERSDRPIGLPLREV